MFFKKFFPFIEDIFDKFGENVYFKYKFTYKFKKFDRVRCVFVKLTQKIH